MKAVSQIGIRVRGGRQGVKGRRDDEVSLARAKDQDEVDADKGR